jgi:hypothetical protein
MEEDRTKDWRELCKAAANEPDPEKMMELIAELIKALDEHEKKQRQISQGNTVDKGEIGDDDKQAGAISPGETAVWWIGFNSGRQFGLP